ncbi:MAG TPA: hypothetical protein VM487_02860 [Phycisphaerae bacterium]|nr:hypothetical protein [Phycisphaerae bacterium]
MSENTNRTPDVKLLREARELTSLCHADDVTTLYCGDRCLGVLEPYAADGQYRRHAERTNPDLGEWVQLTGTVYALGTPNGIDYYHLTDGCPGLCGYRQPGLECPKALRGDR